MREDLHSSYVYGSVRMKGCGVMKREREEKERVKFNVKLNP